MGLGSTGWEETPEPWPRYSTNVSESQPTQIHRTILQCCCSFAASYLDLVGSVGAMCWEQRHCPDSEKSSLRPGVLGENHTDSLILLTPLFLWPPACGFAALLFTGKSLQGAPIHTCPSPSQPFSVAVPYKPQGHLRYVSVPNKAALHFRLRHWQAILGSIWLSALCLAWQCSGPASVTPKITCWAAARQGMRKKCWLCSKECGACIQPNPALAPPHTAQSKAAWKWQWKQGEGVVWGLPRDPGSKDIGLEPWWEW